MSGWQRKKKYEEGKRWKLSGEGKYLASGGEEEREGKGKNYFAKKKEEIFGDGNYLVGRGKEEWRRKSRKISWRRKKFADRTKGRETSRAL